MVTQKVQLRLGLHPLRDDPQVQRVGQTDDGRDDLGVITVMGEVLDEGLVDLQLVEGEMLQIGE